MKKIVMGIIICALAFGALGIWHYYANQVQEWDGKPVGNGAAMRVSGCAYAACSLIYRLYLYNR